MCRPLFPGFVHRKDLEHPDGSEHTPSPDFGFQIPFLSKRNRAREAWGGGSPHQPANSHPWRGRERFKDRDGLCEGRRSRDDIAPAGPTGAVRRGETNGGGT